MFFFFNENSSLLCIFSNKSISVASLVNGTYIHWVGRAERIILKVLSFSSATPLPPKYKNTWLYIILVLASPQMIRYLPRTFSICVFHSFSKCSLLWKQRKKYVFIFLVLTLERFECNSLFQGPKLLKYDALPWDFDHLSLLFKTEISVEAVILSNDWSLLTVYSNMNWEKACGCLSITFLVLVFNYSDSFAHLSPHKDTEIVH